MRNKLYKKTDRFVERNLFDGQVLVPTSGDLAAGDILQLDTAGGIIWSLLDGSNCFKDIVETLRTLFEVDDAETLEEDVSMFCTELLNLGALEEVDR